MPFAAHHDRNCELPVFRGWCSDPRRFAEELLQLVPEPGALFLDEVQHLDEAGLFIKGLVDRGLPCPLLVTGSSSYHLRAKTRESLAGRARRARLFPFTLDEVCQDAAELGPAMRCEIRRERMGRHLVLGGYPAVWLGEEPEDELAHLVQAFLIRDASDLYKIKRPDVFRALLTLAARQVGNLVNLSEWASLLGVSVPTVASYLSIMEESQLLRRVPLFAGGKRAELTATPRVFFLDAGLRNYLVGDLAPFEHRADRGPLLESWLFSELHKSLPFASSILSWRTRSGAEVDLVVRDGEQLVGIEIKAGSLGRPTLSRGARSFIEAYRPRLFLVANLGLEHRSNVAGRPVEWLHAADVTERVQQSLASGQ